MTKKFIKKILKIVGIFFLLMVLFIGSVLAYKMIAKTDSFYVVNSRIKDFEYIKNLTPEMVNTPLSHSPTKGYRHYPTKVHEIIGGEQVTFGYRYFKDRFPLIYDDEQFVKLTFSLPSNLIYENATYELPHPDIQLAYSSGASAWVDRGCHGYPTQGELSFHDVKEQSAQVLAKVKIACKTFFLEDDELFDVNVEVNKVYERINLMDLNPYLGSEGEFPYQSTYR